MAMLRFFTSKGCKVLWKCSHFVGVSVTKKPVSSFVRHHKLTIPARHFSAGSPVGKDALQTKTDKSEEIETLDLDGWKSVMRSQAAFEEKQISDEVEASCDGDDLAETEGDLKDGSSLEATRDLVNMWRLAGKLVPREMTDEELETLAKLTTKSSRKKHLKYLALREGHKLARKEKQEKKKAEREASLQKKREEDEDDEGGQKLKNTLFLQFWNRSLDNLLGWRSAQAMLLGQPLVFDMSYESNMSRRELVNAVSQLMEVEGWNRRAIEPFHLHFCNLQPHGLYKQELVKRYSAEAWDRLLITSTEHQHVDVFPREQLVYLTADSPNVLRTFDHSKVYIIGALVDRSIQTGVSFANAKRLKLATARLPLDEFLHWEIGAKNLTLDQMIRILLTIKETGKWEEALTFVPKRKHDGFHQQQTQMTKNRVRSGTNHGQREGTNKFMRSEERNGGRTFKSQSVYKSHEESGFPGRDRMAGQAGDRENKRAAPKVWTSLKSDIEGRKSPGKNKMWWQED